ncbi:AIFM3 (predicted) [Pycnogonum litorale]
MGASKSSLSCSNKDSASTGGVSGTYNQKASDEVTDAKNDEIVTDLCSVDDIADGQMKDFPVGEGKVLLVKENGKFTALGTKCSHYGAPLVTGVLANGQIVCPWHGACFNSTSGDIEDFPGLDSIPKYEVDIADGRVIVKASKAVLKANKRKREMCARNSEDQRTFLIIGGGGAAAAGVEELRIGGYCGRLVLATQESYLPYDRPKLSKFLDSSGSKLALRSEEYYKEADIEIKLNMKAVDVNPKTKEVEFMDGSVLKYDKLLLATGGTPRMSTSRGNELKNVCYLRNPDDGNYIAEEAKGKNLVIVGNSFIGMEVAAYFATKAKSTTIVSRTSPPFKNVFGSDVGLRLKKMFDEKANVRFHEPAAVDEFIGEDGKLSAVKLDDGTILPADVCLVGMGVVPSVDYIKSSGIELNEKNQIIVDEYLKTSVPDIYAAGDIIEFPLAIANNERVNIGHWQLASYHGKVAALNMLDQQQALSTVPFFWSMLFGKSIRFAGYNHGFEDVIIDGNLDDLIFAAYYIKNDVVVGVASMNMGSLSSEFASVLKIGRKITADQIREDPKCWMSKK